MTRRPATLTLPCPASFWDGEYPCPNEIEVCVYPYRPVRIALDPDDSDPGEAEFLEITGCYHVDTMTKDHEYDIWQTIIEREEDAREAAVNARIDQMQDEAMEGNDVLGLA